MPDYKPMSNKPIPIRNDNAYICDLEKAVPPDNERDARLLQLKMILNYRQAIRELINVMIICRPDISFPLIKLSQYSASVVQLKHTTKLSNTSFYTCKPPLMTVCISGKLSQDRTFHNYHSLSLLHPLINLTPRHMICLILCMVQ